MGTIQSFFLIIFQVLSTLTAMFERDAFYYGCFQNAWVYFRNYVPTWKVRRKFTSIYIIKHLVFKVQPSLSPNLNLLDFYIWGHLKPYYIGLQLNMKVANTFSIRFKPLATAPGPLKWCDIPLLYRMGREKVARLPIVFTFGYCINFCIYAYLLSIK